jgi:signal transduction histidine kinase
MTQCPLSLTPEKLRQRLNLMGNAVKFADSGDEGARIPRNRLVDIFEPFTQPSQSTTLRGTGLGLSVTRKLVPVGRLGNRHERSASRERVLHCTC